MSDRYILMWVTQHIFAVSPTIGRNHAKFYRRKFTTIYLTGPWSGTYTPHLLLPLDMKQISGVCLWKKSGDICRDALFASRNKSLEMTCQLYNLQSRFPILPSHQSQYREWCSQSTWFSLHLWADHQHINMYCPSTAKLTAEVSKLNKSFLWKGYHVIWSS